MSQIERCIERANAGEKLIFISDGISTSEAAFNVAIDGVPSDAVVNRARRRVDFASAGWLLFRTAETDPESVRQSALSSIVLEDGMASDDEFYHCWQLCGVVTV